MPDLDALHQAFTDRQQEYHKALHQWAADATAAEEAEHAARRAKNQRDHSREIAEKGKAAYDAAEAALKQALKWPDGR